MTFDFTLSRPGPRLADECSTADGGLIPGVDERLAIGAQLQIRWEEGKGVHREIRVRAVEVTKSVLRVRSERKIAAGTLVILYTAEFVPIGRALIRECTTKGMDYSIALYVPSRSTPDL